METNVSPSLPPSANHRKGVARSGQISTTNTAVPSGEYLTA